MTNFKNGESAEKYTNISEIVSQGWVKHAKKVEKRKIAENKKTMRFPTTVKICRL